MKLLHLADLHIGKRLHLYDMQEEQRNMLRQIRETVIQEQVDVLLLAGDIYDKSIPTIEAVTILDEFLTDLARLGTCEVILISGNHDSAERMAYGSQLFESCHIHIYTDIRASLQPLISADEYGSVAFYAIPFIKPALVRNAWPEEAQAIASYEDAMEFVLKKLSLDTSVRNVLISHQTYLNHGEKPEISDSEAVTIGGLDSISASLLDEFDYVALGHIHKGQTVGRETMRYSGTPMKYSVNEASQEKGMLLVEMGQKGDTHIQFRVLSPLRDVKILTGSLDELTKSMGPMIPVSEDYVSIRLTDEEDLWMPQERLKKAYPYLLEWSRMNQSYQPDAGVYEQVDLELGVEELFANFYEAMNGQVLQKEQCDILAELLADSQKEVKLP